MKTICLLAAPETRIICPPEFIEGYWKEIPDEAFKVEIKTPPDVRELEVVATGKFQRNESGESAEIYEVRYSSYEVK